MPLFRLPLVKLGVSPEESPTFSPAKSDFPPCKVREPVSAGFDEELTDLNEVEIITNFKTKEPITNINGLPLLRAYYSIILQNYLQ